MSKELKIDAKKREGKDKIKNILESGYIPGVLYGSGIENINLSVKVNEFNGLFNNVGKAKVFDLSVDGKIFNVIIKETQKNIVSGKISHIDFYKINEDKKIIVDVPFSFVGDSPAVKKKGGVLLINKEGVKIKCFPKDLINVIEIDLSQIEDFTNKIRYGDLVLSEKIEIMGAPGELIASITAPKKIVEEVPEAAAEDEKKEEEGDKKEETVEKK